MTPTIKLAAIGTAIYFAGVTMLCIAPARAGWTRPTNETIVLINPDAGPTVITCTEFRGVTTCN